MLRDTTAALAVLLLLSATAVGAQGPPAAQGAPPPAQGQDRPPPPEVPPGARGGTLPTVEGDTVVLADAQTPTRFLFEREVYTYPRGERRDPFMVLSAASGMGPTFDELTLLSTTVVPAQPGRSIAEIRDAAGTVYRVRRGSVLGNVTVLDISRGAVVVGVDEFGVRRQEQLRMRSSSTGGMER
ncbi:MAG: hypothetical protein WEB88_07740 [Gemmatimonadota bacterium]